MPQWSRLVSLSGWVALWQGVISGPHGRKHMRKLSFASTLCCAPSLSASSVPRLKGNNGPIMATAASAQLWTWLQVANFMAQCFTCSTTPWSIPPLPLLRVCFQFYFCPQVSYILVYVFSGAICHSLSLKMATASAKHNWFKQAFGMT